MNDSIFTEKRVFPRFEVSIPVSYVETHSKNTSEARTHDISAGGVGIITEEELPAGTSLGIYLRMVDDGGEIYRRGKVIWSSPLDVNKYRVGIQLEEPNLKPIPIVLRTIKAQRKY